MLISSQTGRYPINHVMSQSGPNLLSFLCFVSTVNQHYREDLSNIWKGCREGGLMVLCTIVIILFLQDLSSRRNIGPIVSLDAKSKWCLLMLKDGSPTALSATRTTLPTRLSFSLLLYFNSWVWRLPVLVSLRELPMSEYVAKDLPMNSLLLSTRATVHSIAHPEVSLHPCTS